MRKGIIPITLLCLAVGPALSFAEMALVPKTGQTTGYSSGDDGTLKMGVAWPSPRFSTNTNGTVTDRLTGLVWLKNANCFNQITWSTAISSVNSLASGTCGLTDGSKSGEWRLPNLLELRSLGNTGQADLSAWLTTQGFTNIQKNAYWASTTLANDTTSALTVDMTIGSGDSGAKTSANFVWPVRNSQ